MTTSTILAAALLVFLPAVALAQNAMPGMDMKGMDMKGMKGVTSPATKAYMQAMQAMHEKTASMKPTNDPDKDFVLMMKPHHEAAVEMAEAYLKYGTDATLKAMAQDIVASQNKEIAAMNAWEATHGLAGK